MILPPAGLSNFQVIARSLPSAAIGDEIIAANSQRVVILIGTVNVMRIWPIAQTDITVGLTLNNNTWDEITWAKHGGLVNMAWYSCTVTGGAISIIEVLYRPSGSA